MESRNPALDALVEGYEAMDNPFPGIDPTRYAPPGGPPSTA
jgi:hypothetical protein